MTATRSLPPESVPTRLGSAPREPARADALGQASLRPGDRVLLTGTGQGSARLADMAAAHGLDVVRCDAAGALAHLLWWDPTIRAVLVPGEATATSDAGDPEEVRRVLELTGSDALLLVAAEDARADAPLAFLDRTALSGLVSLVTHREQLVEGAGRGLGALGFRVCARLRRFGAALTVPRCRG